MPSSDYIRLDQFTLQRLSPDSTLKPFDCGRPDITDYFHNDSSRYARELLSVTYAFESDSETVAFFSVLNDKIINRDSRGKIIANKIARIIPNPKRRPTYPAVKVGRLGVHSKYKRKHIGTQVLTFVKHFFTYQNKTGCRFITVDAYNTDDVLPFYVDNGFKFLTTEDEKEDTRLMWFDLKPFLSLISN